MLCKLLAGAQILCLGRHPFAIFFVRTEAQRFHPQFNLLRKRVERLRNGQDLRTILVNPNIATIQTSDYLADQIYFLPINRYFVERVIEKERPDGIMLGFGGQTALNCGLDLDRNGVLEKYGVRILGTPIQAIRETEDRDLFVKKLAEISVKVPRSAAATSVAESVKIAQEIGYPVMLRVAYALGGLGSGLCVNEDDVDRKSVV